MKISNKGARFLRIKILMLCIYLFLPLTSYTQQTGSEFPVGVFMSTRNTVNRTNPVLYNMFNNSGMNIMAQHSDATTADKIKNKDFNIIADNLDNAQHWIPYYATGYYSKWESEENQEDVNKIGVKHNKINNQYIGQPAEWLGKQCWSSIGLSSPAESLVYGPHYSQGKRYKRSYNGGWLQQKVQYTVRFRMALQRNQTVNNSEDVCKIKVVHRYIYIPSENQNEWVWYNETLLQRTLKVSDFQDSNFQDFNIIDFTSIPPKTTYSYDNRFTQHKLVDNILPQLSEFPIYYDLKENTGIQFCVDWLRADSKCTLYIDYAEVYDNDGWDKYISPSTHNTVISQIYSYTQNYSDWNNLKYWYGQDEPSTIDAILPMKTVASIIDSAGGPGLITAQTIPGPPYWSATNGEYFYKRYIEQVNPEIVMMDYYPFYYNRSTDESLERLRSQLQELSTIRPGFWYIGQGFGHTNVNYNRRPTPEELKATVMLSLAHGCKGIMFWKFDPEQYYTCILNENLGPTDLYEIIQVNIAPRLKDKFGTTLLGLNYSGKHLQYKHITPTENPFPQPLNFDYLTVGLQDTAHDMNWHVGFFDKTGQADNKYFLMSNLWTSSAESIQVEVTAPVQGFINYRFRNIEPETNFDITFTNQSTQTLNFSAGEGYLFQVAPVAKFGGKLVYSETVPDGTTLYDEMTIENGATLTVNGTYYAKANITVKSGGKIVAGTNGKIIFDSGKNIIIDGSAEIKGTSSNRLSISAAASYYGIVINPGSAFIMDYCDIESIGFAISTASGSQSYVNIANSNIVTMYSGISLASSSSYEVFQTPPVPIIQNCRITASFSGISVSNYRSVLLKSNTFSNCGISVSNVVSAYIQDNDISLGSHQNHPGILFNNSGGYIRNNIIKNRSNGIHIANSSPEIGGNLIENNYLHGLYIAGSSIPNLIGQLRTNPPAYYPLAGYNRIRNNGINTQPNSENDGSEIYFSFSDARLGTSDRPGCNEISDDRASSPNMQTIWLLSGIYGNEPHFLDAIYNYWGTTTPTSNRFGIAANFTPFNSSFLCLINGGSTTESLVLMTSSGEIVDSIFAAECVPENISELEEIYPEANLLFARGNLIEAKQIFEQIVLGNYTTEEKLLGYNKLYTIGNLINEDENYFASLQSTFENNANNTTDTLIKKIYNQNAINCDVSKGEYITAINKFDDIIQQNPNSEEAVYAEIDILTAALNLDTNNTLLGKINGGKYLVKGTSDYLSRLNEILQSRFGLNSDESNKIIPKEYHLHQNFPNPFNPTTTIRYDLPKDGLVQLEVFDILGKRITILVNEYKSAGTYDQLFDASQLSSGIYIYRLRSKDFVSSKKMILLK